MLINHATGTHFVSFVPFKLYLYIKPCYNLLSQQQQYLTSDNILINREKHVKQLNVHCNVIAYNNINILITIKCHKLSSVSPNSNVKNNTAPYFTCIHTRWRNLKEQSSIDNPETQETPGTRHR